MTCRCVWLVVTDNTENNRRQHVYMILYRVAGGDTRGYVASVPHQETGQVVLAIPVGSHCEKYTPYSNLSDKVFP